MADEIAPVDDASNPVSIGAPDPTALQVDTAPQTEQSQSIAADAFDPTPFEQEFGLGAGSLKDAKSVDDVLAKIAANPFDDLFDESDADNPSEPPAPNEVEALKQQLAELQQQNQSLQQHLESHLAAQKAEVARRLDAAIDGFASPKYGVGKNRTLKQVQAAAALREKVERFALGLAHAGEEIPPIEVLAARVRQFDDDTFKPTAKPVDRTPLGTPGTQRGGSQVNGEQPRSIHHALQMNATF